MSALARYLNVDDVRRAARRRLPRALFDFVDGGAGDEATVRRNSNCFDKYAFRGSVLAGVAQRDQSVQLFGRTISMPVLIAPTGLSGLLWPAGEAEVARACSAADTVMTVSVSASLSLEAVMAASGAGKWLQLFIYRDRELTRELANRAKAAGYEALCLTVDYPVHGHRERDSRNGFTISPQLRPSLFLDVLRRPAWWIRMATAPKVTFGNFEGRGATGLANVASYMSTLVDPGLTWKDLEWLRAIWDGPLVVKGVMRKEDALRAVELGCNAVEISNHGGRQLDHSIGPLDALPEIADALGGCTPILLDGGIRRGADVLKARALGATAVMIGRAHLWGLAVAGAAGVEHVLRILRDEIDMAMAIGGWRTLQNIDESAVRRLEHAPPILDQTARALNVAYKQDIAIVP